jgi:hypothetical protein
VGFSRAFAWKSSAPIGIQQERADAVSALHNARTGLGRCSRATLFAEFLLSAVAAGANEAEVGSQKSTVILRGVRSSLQFGPRANMKTIQKKEQTLCGSTIRDSEDHDE